MPYRFYPMCNGHIAGPPLEIELDDDAMAVGLSFGLFEDGLGVEIWNEDRKIAHLTAEEMRRHYSALV